MYEWGFTHSTTVIDPVTVTGLLTSKTVCAAWWAHTGVAAAANMAPMNAFVSRRFMNLPTRHDTIKSAKMRPIPLISW